MKFKPGVRVLGIQPEAVLCIMVAERVWAANGAELTVTSVTDGRHSDGSMHHCGWAFDCRTRDLTDKQVLAIDSQLRSSLPPGCDVVKESTHFHIEYDPR